MAMGILTSQTATRTSVPVTTFTALGADGQKFLNTGKEVVIIRRTGASTGNVTFHTNKTKDGVVLPDLTVALAAGNVTTQHKVVGPFPKNRYNQLGGYLEITSAEATDQVAIMEVTPVN